MGKGVAQRVGNQIGRVLVQLVLSEDEDPMVQSGPWDEQERGAPEGFENSIKTFQHDSDPEEEMENFL